MSEELNQIGSADNNDLLYKRIALAGRAYANVNTFHTFDNVFGHVVFHLEQWVKRHTDIVSLETEIINKLPEAQRTKDSYKKLLSRSIFPRIVTGYNIDPSHEKFVDYATMDRLDRIGGNPTIALIEVRRQGIKRKPADAWYYMKDVDLLIFGSPKFQTATIFFSVLVNEEAKAYEVSEMMKYAFPLEVPKPIYYQKQERADMLEPIYIPYTIETMLPDSLILDLKTLFNITDMGTDGDLALLEILRAHSKEQVDYIVDGGNRVRAFVVKYQAPITIVAKSIEEINIEENNVKTCGTKLELLVNYPKFMMYGLSATLERLNLDNPAIRVKDDVIEGFKTYQEIYQAYFTEFTDNKLSLYNMVEVEYAEDDVRIDPDGKKYTVLDIIDTVSEDIKMSRYLEFLYDCYDEEARKDLIYIECKRRNLEFMEYNHERMDPDFKFTDETIIDLRGDADKVVFIALYLNKEHYVRWQEETGYINRSNYSNV